MKCDCLCHALPQRKKEIDTDYFSSIGGYAAIITNIFNMQECKCCLKCPLCEETLIVGNTIINDKECNPPKEIKDKCMISFPFQWIHNRLIQAHKEELKNEKV